MTEPTIGEEGIEAAANALLHGEVWGPQNGPLDEESSEALDRLARAAITAYLATQRAPDEELTVDPNVLMAAVEEAMQRYWDSFVGDTGCVPTEFAIEGPPSTLVSADFAGGNMAECVVEAVLTTLTTGAPDQELRRLRYIERYARSFVMGQGRSRVLSESEWSIYQGHLDALTAALTPPDDGTGQ